MRSTAIDWMIVIGFFGTLGGLWYAWPPLAVIVCAGSLLLAGLYARTNNKGGDDGNA